MQCRLSQAEGCSGVCQGLTVPDTYWDSAGWEMQRSRPRERAVACGVALIVVLIAVHHASTVHEHGAAQKLAGSHTLQQILLIVSRCSHGTGSCTFIRQPLTHRVPAAGTQFTRVYVTSTRAQARDISHMCASACAKKPSPVHTPDGARTGYTLPVPLDVPAGPGFALASLP